MKRSWRLALTFGLLTFALTACARPPAPVEQPRPLAGEAWIAALKARADFWQSYQARLRLKAESPKGKFSLQAVVLAQFPDRFRLDAFKLGQAAGVLVIDGQHASLTIPSERVIYTARDAATLTQAFLGIPISAATLARALVAVAPDDRIEGLNFFESGSEQVARSSPESGGSAFRLYLQPQPPALRAIDIDAAGRSYRIAYEPAVEMAPQVIPRKLSATAPQWQMELSVEQLLPAPDLTATAFAPPAVAGFRSVNLDQPQ